MSPTQTLLCHCGLVKWFFNFNFDLIVTSGQRMELKAEEAIIFVGPSNPFDPKRRRKSKIRTEEGSQTR